MESATVVEAENLSWMETASAGAVQKQLGSAGAFEVSLVQLGPGAKLPGSPADHDLELFVLSGGLVLPEGTLLEGGYARRRAGFPAAASTDAGCKLLVRSGPSAGRSAAPAHVQTTELPWYPGHGNLEVKSIHELGGEHTALVHWPAGERFVPHRHWGGEEIFVLSGTFEDEHGQYPRGTWLLNPHLSTHHPFVREETVILVKTGHLLAASS